MTALSAGGGHHIGEGSIIDPGVELGYLSGRGAEGPLRLGPRARIRSGTVLYAASTIGCDFETGHHVVVRESCTIGDGVSIWANSVIDYGCTLGDGARIHTGCYIAQFTVIGARAFLAPGVVITNDLYPGDHASAAVMAGPVIGVGAQIGGGVTILPYVRIGDGALIGAGSVVTKDIPAGMVAFGNPAVPKRSVESLPPIVERLRGHPLREW